MKLLNTVSHRVNSGEGRLQIDHLNRQCLLQADENLAVEAPAVLGRLLLQPMVKRVRHALDRECWYTPSAVRVMVSLWYLRGTYHKRLASVKRQTPRDG